MPSELREQIRKLSENWQYLKNRGELNASKIPVVQQTSVVTNEPTSPSQLNDKPLMTSTPIRKNSNSTPQKSLLQKLQTSSESVIAAEKAAAQTSSPVKGKC
ncbi:hypothetical protein O3M35_003439 [Rhynocoris fuscipes]|uniref:Uncharacterized protein n=1 Tax=Rhynocoris fuscipes TaxID=488301 RepID=A0AAW1CPZ2_9HEMI